MAAALGYLGLLETLCIGITKEIYDADTTKELYGSRIVAVANNYRSLIDWRRDQTGVKTFYDGLEEVADRFERTVCADRNSRDSFTGRAAVK